MTIGSDGLFRLSGLATVDFNPDASRFTVSRSITADGQSNTLPEGVYLDGTANDTAVQVAYTWSGGSSYTLARVDYRNTVAAINESCTPAPATSTTIAWNGSGVNPMGSLPSTLSCQVGSNAPFPLNPGALVPLREDYQLPIDYVNPTLVTEQNYSYTVMVLGPMWLHLQIYLGSGSIEVDYADAICH